MRRAAFVEFLVSRYCGPNTGRPLPATTAPSYASYAATAERLLGTDLDDLDVSPAGFTSIMSRLGGFAREGSIAPRMVGNCGSALKAYAQFKMPPAMTKGIGIREPARQIAPSAPTVRSRQAPASPPYDPTISHMSVRGLLAMHGAILDELRTRGVVRTGNSPVGDFAETLFARAFGWTLAANSALGFDATDSEGVRYQIKGRRLSRTNGSRQLSAIRRLPDKAFDQLAAVLFDEAYGITRAIIIPHALIEPRARFRSHTNSWLFMLTDDVWTLSGVRDVSAQLRAAAADL